MPTKDNIVKLKSRDVKTCTLNQALEQMDLPGLEKNLFSSLDWMLVLLKTYKLKLYVKYIEEDGAVVSYIIYSAVKNFLEWKLCICSYCDYCDCYVSSREHWQLFLDDLKKEYPQYRIAIRNLRDPHVGTLETIKELSREKHHLLELDDDVDTLWKNTHRTFKVACKRAKKEGVFIQRCSREGLDDFYRLHLQLRKNKYRLFPQPYRFFENIWNQYMAQDKGVLLGAYNKHGHMIAASIYLICADTSFYKFSTSSLEALKLRPNNLLKWEGLKYACEKGLKFMDLGSSGCEQAGLIWYKTHILRDTKESDIVHLGYAPEDYTYSRKIILKTYTKLLTMPWVPDSVVKWGSNLIYPFLA